MSVCNTVYFQCPRRACKASGNRVKSLTKKAEPLCVHNYLIFKAELDSDRPTPKTLLHEVDRKLTVLEVIRMIKNNFPSASEDPCKLLKVNKEFINSLCGVKNINSELLKHCEKLCPLCGSDLVKWPHKTKDSYLVSLAEVKKIQVEAQFCDECKLLVYYNLYAVGCIPLHNKVIKLSGKLSTLQVDNVIKYRY